MRVFLDTNVVASALAGPGVCMDVLQLCIEEHDLLGCEEVVAELDRALRSKFRLPGEIVEAAVRYYRAQATFVSSRPPRDTPHPDPADRAILSAARNGAADVFVTGDGAVRALRRIGTMQILTPREFWEGTRPEAVGEGR